MIPFICLSIKYTPRGLRSTTFPGIQTPRVPDQYRTTSPTAYSGRPALLESSVSISSEEAPSCDVIGVLAVLFTTDPDDASIGFCADLADGEGIVHPMKM